MGGRLNRGQMCEVSLAVFRPELKNTKFKNILIAFGFSDTHPMQGNITFLLHHNVSEKQGDSRVATCLAFLFSDVNYCSHILKCVMTPIACRAVANAYFEFECVDFC